MSTRLYTRKTCVLLKLESSEGVDPTPSASTDALLVSELNINPLEVQTVSLDYIRSYYGSSPSIITSANVTVDFTIDLAGAGAAATVPAWASALEVCGWSAADTESSATTGTAQAGASGSITLEAGASSTNNNYVGTPVVRTSGTNFGTGLITAYNGTTKVATAVGMSLAPDATSAYSITAHNRFAPLTDACKSATMYVYASGLFHKVTGLRGKVSLELAANGRPAMKFSMIGVYNAVTDVAVATGVYTSWTSPAAVLTANTTGYFFGKSLSGGASGLALSKFMLDDGADQKFLQRVGTSGVAYVGRVPRAQVSIEAPLVAELDVFGAAVAGTTGTFILKHGNAAGNYVAITLPSARIENPKYSDDSGVRMIDMDLVPLPTAGNDDVFITTY